MENLLTEERAMTQRAYNLLVEDCEVIDNAGNNSFIRLEQGSALAAC